MEKTKGLTKQFIQLVNNKTYITKKFLSTLSKEKREYAEKVKEERTKRARYAASCAWNARNRDRNNEYARRSREKRKELQIIRV